LLGGGGSAPPPNTKGGMPSAGAGTLFAPVVATAASPALALESDPAEVLWPKTKPALTSGMAPAAPLDAVLLPKETLGGPSALASLGAVAPPCPKTNEALLSAPVAAVAEVPAELPAGGIVLVSGPKGLAGLSLFGVAPAEPLVSVWEASSALATLAFFL
jgi:hypothetical protein